MADEATRPEPSANFRDHLRSLPNPHAGVTGAANPITQMPATTAWGLEMAITMAAMFNADQRPTPTPEPEAAKKEG